MRSVRLTATGHPAVTGRHDKTLELTAEDAITARATCILGVAAGPIPGELPTLRGTVRLTIAADGAAGSVLGEVNPAYASADRLVVRRSDQADPDTFLLNASGAAADLPPELLTALARPGAAVEVTATEVGVPAPVLLVLLPGPPPGPDLARLAASADLVVDLTGRGAPAPAVRLTAPRRHGRPGPLSGLRTVVVLAGSADQVPPVVAALPGARVALWPPYPGADLLLAAGHCPVPALHAGPLPDTPTARRDLARRLAAAAVPAVLDIPAPHHPPATPLATTPDTLPAATKPLLHQAQHSPTPPAATGPDTLPAATKPLLHQAQQRLTHLESTTGEVGVAALEGRSAPARTLHREVEQRPTDSGRTTDDQPQPATSAGDQRREAAREAPAGGSTGSAPADGGSADGARAGGSTGKASAGGGPAGSGPAGSGSARRGAGGGGSAVGEVWAALPGWRLVLPDPAVGWGVGARVAAPGEDVDLRGLRRAPVVAFVPPDGIRPLTVDAAELARLLRAAGASGRDAAAALVGLGLPRREAYRLAAGQP